MQTQAKFLLCLCCNSVLDSPVPVHACTVYMYAQVFRMKFNIRFRRLVLLEIFFLKRYFKQLYRSLQYDASNHGTRVLGTCYSLLMDSVLKGQCHEDFAVLDQFWAKIITLRLYSLTIASVKL